MMMARTDMAGALLAGGQSRRFGSRKDAALFRGRRLLDHALDSLEMVSDELFIATGKPQLFRDVTRARIVQDIVPNKGPLGGIVTAFHSTDRKRLFVLACDIIVNPDVVAVLAKPLDAQAVVAMVDDHPQYLCSIYSRDILEHFESCIEKDVLSVEAALSGVSAVRFIDIPRDSISNINTLHELKKLSGEASRAM